MLHVEVVTPAGVALAADADEVTAPGVRGEFGVLPGHTPFVSALKAGVLSYKGKTGKRGVLAVGPGFAEVSGRDQVVILTQQATPAEQVDVAAAQRELDETDRQLKELREGTGRGELEARRAWAQARLDAKKA